jgi:hypothetical protein
MTSRRFTSPVCVLWLSSFGVALACAPSASEDDSPGLSATGSGGAAAGPNGSAGTNGTAGASGGTIGAAGATIQGGWSAVGGWPSVGGVTSTGGYPPLDLPYTDDFEDSLMDRWIRLDDGTITTAAWPIVVDSTAASNHVLQLGSSSNDTWEVGGSYAWTDQVFQVRLRFTGTSGYAYIAVRWERVAGDDNYYYLQIDPDSSKPKIRARYNGSTTDVCAATVNFVGTVGTWYTVTVTAQGSTLSASIDGTLVCTGTNASIPAGGIAVGSDGFQVFFDDVRVTATAP